MSPNAIRVDPALRDLAKAALVEADEALRTVSGKVEFSEILAAPLTLVAPVGMAPADKRDWYRAAWTALHEVPADLLRIGASSAARTADHPAKIVPAILAAVDALWRQRRLARTQVLTALEKMDRRPMQIDRDDTQTAKSFSEFFAQIGDTDDNRGGLPKWVRDGIAKADWKLSDAEVDGLPDA